MSKRDDSHKVKPAPSPTERCAACGHGAHGNHVCQGCLMGCGSSLPPPAPSPANIKTRAEERFIRAALRQVYGPTAWNENERFVKAARAVARERGRK